MSTLLETKTDVCAVKLLKCGDRVGIAMVAKSFYPYPTTLIETNPYNNKAFCAETGRVYVRRKGNIFHPKALCVSAKQLEEAKKNVTIVWVPVGSC
ncbi:MAG TPA: hypothetical protein PK263_02435 [bacterium]|nr:hypothetical protein [bacterium]